MLRGGGSSARDPARLRVSPDRGCGGSRVICGGNAGGSGPHPVRFRKQAGHPIGRLRTRFPPGVERGNRWGEPGTGSRVSDRGDSGGRHRRDGSPGRRSLVPRERRDRVGSGDRLQHPARSGVAVGGGATLRYNFLSGKRLVPFLDANAGIVHLDFDLQHQSDGFNFNVGFGGGFHRFMSRRTALTTSIRWQHFSNLGTNLPNDGINAVQFLIGVSYFWE
ncbi:MAG: acyloxyacyl hydrolase [Myxococcota bacterium]